MAVLVVTLMNRSVIGAASRHRRIFDLERHVTLFGRGGVANADLPRGSVGVVPQSHYVTGKFYQAIFISRLPQHGSGHVRSIFFTHPAEIKLCMGFFKLHSAA